jgi:hypothetical protein
MRGPNQPAIQETPKVSPAAADDATHAAQPRRWLTAGGLGHGCSLRLFGSFDTLDVVLNSERLYQPLERNLDAH